MLVGLLGIYHLSTLSCFVIPPYIMLGGILSLLFVFHSFLWDISFTVLFFVSLFVRKFFVMDISGMGCRGAMKFGRMVDLGG